MNIISDEEFYDLSEWFKNLSPEERKSVQDKLIDDLVPIFRKKKDILTLNENNEIVQIKLDK